METKSIRLPLELVKRIDKQRGGVPRERWVREELEWLLHNIRTANQTIEEAALKAAKERSA